MIKFSDMNVPNERTLMIVDALNLSFRWKHSGAKEFVEDYIATVNSLKKSYKASHVIIACDEGSSSYRKNLLPEYKQNRKEKQALQTPEEEEAFKRFFQEFLKTIDTIKDIYPVLRFSKCEADDIGAYIVKNADKYNLNEIWLISSDRDWDLLINERTSRFSYVTRKEITTNNWDNHYDVSLDSYISYKCLIGDPGDNVPGVHGVGPKRAVSLLNEYGTAYDIAANIPLPGKYAYIKALNEFGADSILRNYRLMDLIEYCDDALGDNTKEIDKILGEYLK